MSEALHVWPTGTHSIRVLNGSAWSAGDLDFEAWAFAFVDATLESTFGEAPRITEVVSEGADLVEVFLDAAMHPGIDYSIDPPGLDASTLIGPVRNRAKAASPEDRVLLDIDAPVIRDDGQAGGITLGADRDYAMSSDRATVEKAIWSLVLTTRGERYWDPGAGSDLRHKSVRAVDTRDQERRLEVEIEAIPYVTTAVVRYLWERGHQVVTITANTDFGRVEGRREVT